MAQHDGDVANQTFPAFRADMNNFFNAISSQQSGASDPPATVQFQYFADTTNDLLKRRNVGDSAFLPFDTLLDSRVATKTTNYTQLLADMNRLILLDASSGDLTVTLLDAAIAQNGFVTTFKRIDSSANVVLLDNFGGQTIDGVADLELIGENATAKIRSNGTNLFRESKVLGKPPLVISTIPIGFQPSQSFTVNTFTRISKVELTDSSNLPVRIWDKSVLLSGRVFLFAMIEGTAGTPFTGAFQIVANPDGTPITVFETNDLSIGNQTADDYSYLGVDVSTGNVTNLDLTTTLLNAVNAASGGFGDVKEWEINFRANISSGAYQIRGLEWQLLDY